MNKNMDLETVKKLKEVFDLFDNDDNNNKITNNKIKSQSTKYNLVKYVHTNVKGL